jgi:hypothetical protein
MYTHSPLSREDDARAAAYDGYLPPVSKTSNLLLP